MNKFLSYLLFLLLTSFVVLEALAQDPAISHLFANRTQLNPAFAGIGTGSRIASSYRAQWIRIPGFYKTLNLAFDQPFGGLNEHQGIGLTFMGDVAGEGPLINSKLQVNYAIEKEIASTHFLRLGVAMGGVWTTLDGAKLRFLLTKLTQHTDLSLLIQTPCLRQGGIAFGQIWISVCSTFRNMAFYLLVYITSSIRVLMAASSKGFLFASTSRLEQSYHLLLWEISGR